ncbi:hypothetical protein JVT61DRAFT_1156 [Boletus reticuloceps]|uniref:rRNA biogenesis protein RRP36 n=1 Tax=Boletus reticuloceps TaxID=495285 RepID=A0A8I3ACA6_9AGAM|nr:hypothetical protein JVT61DRAFT_1156 [Boletus reticuloceps]
MTLHHENGQQSKAQLAKQARPKAIDFLSGSEGAERAHPSTAHLQRVHDDDDESDDSDDTNVDPGTDEEDIDAPRVAQWISDDLDLELQEQTDDASDAEGVDSDDNDNDHSGNEAGPSRRLRSLQDDLSTLPLGTLRSAQRSLARVQALSDTESDSEEQSEGNVNASEDDDTSLHPTNEESPNQPSKPNKGPAKRTNKHAPVEITSKRPVSRRRLVVDDTLPKPRDPRFMHATGCYDPSKFKQQYEFLSGLRHDELATLRGHVKRARKLLANSPSHLRVEREEEVKRLELATKRAESTVNMNNKERIEFKALQSAKQTEKEKRKQGKAEWWINRSAKKQLLSKARLDAIASDGGKRAVKKAIEKKQKKINQKEKKMRPFPRSEGIERSDGKRRRPVGAVD